MGAIYDKQAEAFARFSRTSFTWKYLEAPAFDRHLAGYYNGHTQVLDAGCGSGRVAEHLIACGVAPTNIIGVDIGKANIQIAQKMVSGPKFIEADMRTITLPSESVDLVIAHMMLEFLDPDGLREALQKFHQVLRKEGALVYITTHPKSVLSEIGVDALKGWHTRRSPWGTEIQNYYRSKDELVAETKKCWFP